MQKRLESYIAFLMSEFEKNLSDTQLDNLEQDLLIQIGFFSHERLVHLLVTCLFALLTMGALMLSMLTQEILCAVLTIAFLIPLIPYIRHYYILENGVQRLYTFYDAIRRRKNG